jgi:hypothetical protein
MPNLIKVERGKVTLLTMNVHHHHLILIRWMVVVVQIRAFK